MSAQHRGGGEAFGGNGWAEWMQRSWVWDTMEHGISMLLDWGPAALKKSCWTEW